MTTNEETLYRNGTQGTPQSGQNENGSVNEPVADTEKKKFGSNTAARAAAVAGGVLAGTGVAYAINEHFDGGGEDVVTPELPADDTLKVTTEDDSLSFEEAFNDARAHVGPGGAFRWHGGIYNTYTENEWNNMSDAEKAEYNAKVAPLATGTERAESTYTNNASHHPNVVSQQNEIVTNKTNVVIDQEDNYHITSEETGEIQGQEVILGYGTHNGNEMVVVDVDRDGKYDYIIEDVNQDGTIADNEIQDISGYNIGVGNERLVADNVRPVTPEPVGPRAVPASLEVEVDNEYTDVVNGKEVIVGVGSVDGTETVFIDVDKNGVYDVAAGDFNQNGVMEEDEVVDIRAAGMEVENKSLLEFNDVAQTDPSMTDPNLDDPSQGLPDYAPDCI